MALTMREKKIGFEYSRNYLKARKKEKAHLNNDGKYVLALFKKLEIKTPKRITKM